MSANVPTFEEVDKHIQSANLSALKPSGQAATGSAAIPNVCQAYGVIRPILALVAGVPLIPKKWRDAINAFMQVLDSICPQN
jgi:predicted DCC family thiol-disulfide oxidoreductase YuxK